MNKPFELLKGEMLNFRKEKRDGIGSLSERGMEKETEMRSKAKAQNAYSILS